MSSISQVASVSLAYFLLFGGVYANTTTSAPNARPTVALAPGAGPIKPKGPTPEEEKAALAKINHLVESARASLGTHADHVVDVGQFIDIKEKYEKGYPKPGKVDKFHSVERLVDEFVKENEWLSEFSTRHAKEQPEEQDWSHLWTGQPKAAPPPDIPPTELSALEKPLNETITVELPKVLSQAKESEVVVEAVKKAKLKIGGWISALKLLTESEIADVANMAFHVISRWNENDPIDWTGEIDVFQAGSTNPRKGRTNEEWDQWIKKRLALGKSELRPQVSHPVFPNADNTDKKWVTWFVNRSLWLRWKFLLYNGIYYSDTGTSCYSIPGYKKDYTGRDNQGQQLRNWKRPWITPEAKQSRRAQILGEIQKWANPESEIRFPIVSALKLFEPRKSKSSQQYAISYWVNLHRGGVQHTDPEPAGNLQKIEAQFKKRLADDEKRIVEVDAKCSHLPDEQKS